jgi:nitrogen fixation protein NifU and related proteins
VNAALYDEAIKALARAAHGAGTLATADAVVRLDNPYCGDRIDLTLALTGDRVAAVAHETKGCLLCCACASLIGLRAPGADIAQVQQAIVALDAVLAGRDLPPDAWREMRVFTPVRDYPARHGCVGLPIQALRRAIDMALLRQLPSSR